MKKFVVEVESGPEPTTTTTWVVVCQQTFRSWVKSWHLLNSGAKWGLDLLNFFKSLEERIREPWLGGSVFGMCTDNCCCHGSALWTPVVWSSCVWMVQQRENHKAQRAEFGAAQRDEAWGTSLFSSHSSNRRSCISSMVAFLFMVFKTVS